MISFHKLSPTEQVEAQETLTHYDPKDVEVVTLSYNIIMRYAPFWVEEDYNNHLAHERTLWLAWGKDPNLFDEIYYLVSKTQFVIERSED